MITEPTVLILGAGASQPYGFPSGRRLKALAEKNDQAVQVMLQKLGFDENTYHEFRNTLFYSGQPSVDAFLEHRPEFLNIGKASIAIRIIACEGTGKLFPEEMEWYEYLFNQKLRGSSFETFWLC